MKASTIIALVVVAVVVAAGAMTADEATSLLDEVIAIMEGAG